MERSLRGEKRLQDDNHEDLLFLRLYIQKTKRKE